MNRTCLLLLLIASGCAPSDPNKSVISGNFEVKPGEFMYHKVNLEGMGTYTLTITPEGGDVEAWLAPGEARPMVVYNPNEPLGMAKWFKAGQEDSATGSYAWGGHHIVVFSRGSAPVKVRCKLVTVKEPKKT
ncbi:MAG TPA: hypothetical protein VNM14_25195 [Planctomycetota bacterium]|jgi:hypothetical protein|nr:hypothetical protein [Planctomycetota bacterium]